MTSRNYVFTCYAHCEDASPGWPEFYNIKFDDMKHFRYLKCQRERCPDTGRLHIQGYVEFLSPVRISLFQKFIGEKCHMYVRLGTQQQAIDYCDKEATRECEGCWEMGTKAETSGGCRTESMIKWIISNPEADWKTFVTQWESDFLRYNHACERIFEMFKPQPKMFEFDSLLPVQEEMLKVVDEQNNRQIAWIYDDKGGAGKSELANYLADRGDTFWASSGKTADIIHSYSKCPKPVVVIDLMRCTGSEVVPYSLMEAFKNGRAFTGKYDSRSLCFSKCKVIVLSNMLPDQSKLSADRWDIWQIDRDKGKNTSCHLSRGGGNTSPTPSSPQGDNLMIEPED